MNASRAAAGSPARSSASPRASSTGPASVLGVRELERVERAGEALGRVLVGEAVERAAAGADEHLGGAAGVGRRGRLEQVHRDLLEVAVLAERGQRLGRAAGAAARGAAR